ncbi:MMPL family transporter [Curtobacterium sp. MCBA15_012]|uniref:MMPL family transporter n=1 Tax=Curtobacterium sp. MCBA15_012 TaxID=1898738 RepID=UPI0008DDE40B|nr:MMPL family transporter [Curtobacterium sp. MCBA15_012]WIB00261.1 MMPL family transporter [Curtobacterium sp. MCBA15_012]
MAKWLSGIGRSSSQHPWVVIVAWVLILVAAVVGANAFSKPLTNSYSVKGLASLSTLSTADREFGSSGNAGEIVFAAPAGKKLTGADERAVHDLAARLSNIRDVSSAADPFRSGTPTISPDGRVGYITVSLRTEAPTETTSADVQSAIDATHRLDPHLRIAAAADLVPVPSTASTEGIALAIGFVVLFITFGSLLAAGLPLITAIIGLGVSLEAVYLVTSMVSLNSIATVLATLLGLAVGIDYALFIVNRHRRQVQAGMDVRDSISVATGTAGSAVLSAALTVIIALAGLAVIRIGFLTQMGLAGAFAVLIALLMSLTLTPALLRLIGPRVLSRRARKRLTATNNRPRNRIASRWIGVVSARPVFFVIASVVVLGIIAAPALSMRTTLPNDGEYSTSTAARQAFDMKAEGFGKGINAPIEVLATFPGTPSAAEITALTDRLTAVNAVEAAIPSGEHGHDALITILPRSGPGDEATAKLVTTLRGTETASGLSGDPLLRITGLTAVDIDISDHVSAAFPTYLALIAAFAFVLLTLVFRSILVPLKATVGFLLSLVATLGGVTAVFQWGWLGSFFHLTPGPLLSFLPVIVTGVLFGLSMDYEMFLVSGMREEVRHGAAPRAALTTGFTSAAGVVIAAGAIMITVFGSSAFDTDPTSQAIAFALALGVLLDVFVVRMVFVPAVLVLLGRAAWWCPRWFGRLLPDVDVEGARLTSNHAAKPATDDDSVGMVDAV